MPWGNLLHIFCKLVQSDLTSVLSCQRMKRAWQLLFSDGTGSVRTHGAEVGALQQRPVRADGSTGVAYRHNIDLFFLWWSGALV